ncbi:MAG: DUF2919 family protein [Gammaproteobacteria bacterium]|nr:DUF2919 family protein [Gammaproteobacteria bacterium]MBU1732920.1 DUF2919 family protein [Gammaproteobacteria bacterium]MBU1891968.1 DUF2919 family protein [Gammaproteobacteria bacterium]
MLKYNAHNYDEFLQLKIPFLLWCAILYGVRHFFFIAASKLMPHDVATTPWMELQAHVNLIWSDLPSLLVLIATGHRVPEASRIMRWVWLHGRGILIGSYLLGFVIFFYLHLNVINDFGSSDFMSVLVALLTDIVIAAYVLRSELVKDVFRDFPEAKSELETRHKSGSSLRQLKQELDKDLNTARRSNLLRERIMESQTPVDLQNYAGAEPHEWLQSAIKLESAGKLAEAESLYRGLLEVSPDSAPAWHALGLIAYQTGKYEVATAFVKEAILLEGKVGLYQRNLGEMYRRMGRMNEAIQHGQCACRLSPKDADARFNLGLALTDAGRLTEAITSYRDAVKLNPTHGVCWHNLGVVLQAVGETEGAKDAYGQALILNPANVEAQKQIKQLHGNRGNAEGEYA